MESFSPALNAAIFAAAAAVVWLAGTRTSGYADAIAERTGIGKALIGALLLGGITSLPEMAATTSASLIGNAPLAVNNIFGGVAMQITILAAADIVVGRRALSSAIAHPSLLLQGTLLVLLLGMAAMAIVIGDTLVFGVGLWTVAILAATLLSFYLMHHHDRRDTWEPEKPHAERTAEAGTDDVATASGTGAASDTEVALKNADSLAPLLLKTAVAAAAILVAGFILSRTGDALAEQTGLGDDFMGAVLVAIATSLPEVSTTLGAVRLGEYGMAIANLFGANILDLSILFLADVAYAGPPVLNEVGRFSTAATLLGILLTTIYLAGMLERRQRVMLRMGVDSLIVVVMYVAGIIALYRLR